MLLLGFVCLQVMDALTTLLFLHHGVGEANPLIRGALAIFGHPALALAAPKVFAMALGVYAWSSGRHGLLRRMNFLFALFVGWNLVAVLVNRTIAFTG
jgi:hypothetical protein